MSSNWFIKVMILCEGFKNNNNTNNTQPQSWWHGVSKLDEFYLVL